MPVFKTRTVFEVARNIRAFLNLEGGVIRGPVLGPSADKEVEQSQFEGQFNDLRQSLNDKDEEISRLKAALAAKISELDSGGVSPESLIWIFGNGRTGSTWLSHMMKDLSEHRLWPEPNVGDLFGSIYYKRAREGQLASGNFVLGTQQKNTWLKAIRTFVLQSVNGRFPDLTRKEYLVIKEPHGSLGAPLIMEALPESRMILLVRDPRDVVSSSLDSLSKESWGSKLGNGQVPTQIAQNPDAFVKNQAQQYRMNMGNSKQAYELHEGRKVMVRYEDLRADTFATMRWIYSKLEIPVDDSQLDRVVKKHAWESIPEEKKGKGKFYRQATPGAWGEDLTPNQVKIVENETASLLKVFYGFESEVNRG